MGKSIRPSRYLHCKEDHPVMKKLDALIKLADELDICFEFDGWAETFITDGDEKYLILDIEKGSPITEFPPALEFHVLRDNPAYFEWEQKLKEESERCLADERRQREEEEEEEEKEKQRKRAEYNKEALTEMKIKRENEERQLLAELKAKYEK